MLETYKKENFREDSKAYNVNMCGDVRTLHRLNGCHCSKWLSPFIPFDTLEEVEKFETQHNVNFKRCKNRECFPIK